jgi:hypothetical protein
MAVVRCPMPSTGVLTTDDLDEISCSFDDQSLAVAGELVDAVDQGLVADQADTGYALMLAAEITERGGDLPAALVLARRAVEAYRAQDDRGGYPQAYYAELLLRLGRVDEAMAELSALRPLLSEDADAVSLISEAWEAGGHPEIAEQWLTEALATALGRQESETQQAELLVFELAQERHRLRRDLDLPHDDYDDLAHLLMDVVFGTLSDDEPDDEGTALLYWPQAEFDRLLERWPVLAEEYGQTWDEHRTRLQRTLLLLSEIGASRLGLLAASVDDLAHYVEHTGGDPTDPQVRDGYAAIVAEQAEQSGAEQPGETPWPPGRNLPCWCGSALKYKKCCLPRARP